MGRALHVAKKTVTTVLTCGLVVAATAAAAQDCDLVGVPGMEGFHLD